MVLILVSGERLGKEIRKVFQSSNQILNNETNENVQDTELRMVVMKMYLTRYDSFDVNILFEKSFKWIHGV